MDAGVPLHAPQQMLNEREVVRQAGRQAIRQFLESHSCFSVLRASGKLVVFDTRIPIQLAFYALVEHGTWRRQESAVPWAWEAVVTEASVNQVLC